MNKFILILLAIIGPAFMQAQDTKRIVATSPAISETIHFLGLGKSIVGTDITSSYPPYLNEVPKLGRGSDISFEGILSLNPTHVVINTDQLSAKQQKQLRALDIQVLAIDHTLSLDGTKKLIAEVAAFLSERQKGEQVIQQYALPMERLQDFSTAPKVLFIYARGAGQLLVGGRDTQMHEVITLSKAENAAQAISGYKPLTTEALVELNPDVVLLFDHGSKSLNGINGVMQIPGLQLTTAGKEKNILSMEASYLAGFGPRQAQAIQELNTQLHGLNF